MWFAVVSLCFSTVPWSLQVRQPGPGVPPPVPTVVEPTEGQVVSGDVVLAVQLPQGIEARSFTVEAAYWDVTRNAWVYPGTLGREFGGGRTARLRIGVDTRSKATALATRWRVRARAVDPPGSWGPWREFTWSASDPARAPANCSGKHLDETKVVAKDAWALYQFPICAKQRVVVRTFSTGDVDLYLRQNIAPTLSSYDMRAYTDSGNETLTYVADKDGRLIIGVHGFSSSSSFVLKTSDQ